MKSIKDRIYSIKEMFKRIFSIFPITTITIFIVSAICAIVFDTDIISSKMLENIMFFSVIFASSTFLIESTITDKINKRNKYYILSMVFAGLLTYLVNIDYNIFGIDNFEFLNFLAKFTYCYLITVILIAIYFLYKKSKQLFEEYLTHVTGNIFKTTIIYGLLAIGIAIITAIFIFLILDGDDYSLILRIEILILGLYYIPGILYNFYDIENSISKFEKKVIKYVLDLLVIIAFAIIYMYITKILILRDMPSNQIYRIVAALFIVGCPIWMMTSYFDEDKLLDRINRKLPILFIPFILLQIYTIGIRIINYGFTELRYLAVMLIIFEIIYIIIYLINKKKIGNILIVLIILTLISVIIPYINMFSVSEYSQYNNLKIYKEKTNYTAEEKSKIIGAYQYLRFSENGEKLINKLLTKQDRENIEDLYNKEDYYYDDKIEYVYANKNMDSINIDGYKKLYKISAYKYYNSNSQGYMYKEFKNIEFDNNMYLDLYNIINNYILNKENIDTYFSNNNEAILNENQKIIFERIDIAYNEEKQTIDNYSIEAYLLEK